MKQKTQVAVIPAIPGFRLVVVNWEEKDVSVWETVIAWRIETTTIDDRPHSDVFPLTSEGEGSGQYGIQQPDGQIVFIGGMYNDMDDFKARVFLEYKE